MRTIFAEYNFYLSESTLVFLWAWHLCWVMHLPTFSLQQVCPVLQLNPVPYFPLLYPEWGFMDLFFCFQKSTFTLLSGWWHMGGIFLWSDYIFTFICIIAFISGCASSYIGSDRNMARRSCSRSSDLTRFCMVSATDSTTNTLLRQEMEPTRSEKSPYSVLQIILFLTDHFLQKMSALHMELFLLFLLHFL